MADLQDVDPAQQATLQQHGLDRHLGVAGEQRPEAAAAQQQHHRRVVDVALGQRPGNVLRAGIEDAKACRRPERMRRRPAPAITATGFMAGQRQEAGIGRVLVRRGPDRGPAPPRSAPGRPSARRRGPRAGGSASSRRCRRCQNGRCSPSRRRVRSGSGPPSISIVCAGRRRHQDGVALPDVQRDEVQPAVGPLASVSAPSERDRHARPAASGRARRANSAARPCATSSVRALAEAVRRQLARRPTRQRASAGYQAAASQGGPVSSTDANGTAAAACPATIMARSRQNATCRRPAQPSMGRRRCSVADGSQRRGERAQQHHQRHQRHDHDVGDRRDEREPLEVAAGRPAGW